MGLSMGDGCPLCLDFISASAPPKFFRGHRKHPDRGYHPHGSLDLLSAALAGSATSQHLTDLLSQRWPDLPAPLFDYVPSTNMLNSGLWRQWLHYMFFSLLDLAHA